MGLNLCQLLKSIVRRLHLLVLFIWWVRRIVPVVEVQFVQAVSEKDADNDPEPF
ncbi:hypothetical protein V1515DRAFT_596932 [Lipomyces mesembrius]